MRTRGRSPIPPVRHPEQGHLDVWPVPREPLQELRFYGLVIHRFCESKAIAHHPQRYTVRIVLHSILPSSKAVAGPATIFCVTATGRVALRASDRRMGRGILRKCLRKCAALFLAVGLLGLPLALAQDLMPLDHVAAGTPYSSVGRVHPGSGSYCTGVLLARDMAITAAHCLYNPRTGQWLLPGSIHFLMGYDRGAYGFHTRVKDYQTGGFDPTNLEETLHKDWAILHLADKAPSEYAALDPVRGSHSPDRFFRVVGYASPRRYALSTSGECTGLRQGDYLLSECPSAEGMSGAPLIDQVSGRLIGIQVARMAQGERELLVALPAASWVSRLDRSGARRNATNSGLTNPP